MTPSADNLRALVDDMLLDAGHAGDAELRGALLSLGSLAHLPAPAPSGQLARLMAGSAEEPAGARADETDHRQGRLEDAPHDELALRRRLRRHRPTVLGLALIAGMGTGIGGVAASSPIQGQTGSSSVQQLLEDWTPSWSIPVQAAATGLLPGAADSIPEPVTGEPATEPGSSGRSPAEIPPQQQDVSSGQQLARGPYASFLASPAAGHASRGKGATGMQENGHGRPASEAPMPDGGTEGQPGLDVSATGAEGQPAEEAGLVPGIVAEPLKEVARHGGDAIEAVAGSASRDSWLQKFTR